VRLAKLPACFANTNAARQQFSQKLDVERASVHRVNP
jgi:hypothetical protein